VSNLAVTVGCWCVGDVNFAPELSDLRYRHHLRVILIHRRQVTDALLSCAHECYNFLELFADVTDRRVDEVLHVLYSRCVFIVAVKLVFSCNKLNLMSP